MKSVINYIEILALIIFTFFLSDCRKFVEVPPPITSLVTADVFADAGAATSAQTSIYSQMYANYESLNMSLYCGLLGDELKNYSSSQVHRQYYTNSLTAINNPGCWQNAYNYIYQCNAIISGLQNNTAIVQSIKQQLTGESLFLRAFWHFYLANCYGDVPLVTTTDYSVNKDVPRSPKKVVYSQVLADLRTAAAILNNNFIDASDTTQTTDRERPNKWAAEALLARVYLYNGQYDSAEFYSTALINNTTLFTLLPDLTKVFLANSQEAIWQIGVPLPNLNGFDTPDGYGFILISGPTIAQTISSQLMSSFEAGDARQINWIGSYTDTTGTYYYPYKYKELFSGALSEFTAVLRLAEQYLIRAEARAMQNNISGAILDLNIIRNRASLPNTTANNQADVLTAILHERQVELFTEWGHRWFDLIRTNNVNSVMNIVNPSKGGTGWSPDWQLFPIPENDIKLDLNLTQNTGY